MYKIPDWKRFLLTSGGRCADHATPNYQQQARKRCRHHRSTSTWQHDAYTVLPHNIVPETGIVFNSVDTLFLVEHKKKMKAFGIFSSASVILLSLAVAQAFTAPSLPTCRSSKVVSYGYVPAGFTPEEYKKFKENEAKQKAKKNLGGLGPRGFKSRSFQSFQEALERGETTHLMPVFNAKEKVRRGEIKMEDIPVRGLLKVDFQAI